MSSKYAPRPAKYVAGLKTKITQQAALIKKLETDLAAAEEKLRNEAVIWSVEDFEQQAIDYEENHCYGLQVFDRRKFQEALNTMIRKHDATIGITWDTIDCYLEQCKYTKLQMACRILSEKTGIQNIYDWNVLDEVNTNDEQIVDLLDENDNVIGKTSADVLTDMINILETHGIDGNF
jgi:hypothetical protein